MPFRAVLFDLDGTLLDTLDDIAGAANRSLDRFGFPRHEVDSYRYFVGDGMAVLAERVLPAGCRDAATVTSLVFAIEQEYDRCWAGATHPYQGVAELLDVLTIRGFDMAVLSNKPDHFVRQTVSSLLPRWQFKAVQGLRPGGPRKPDPSGALEIARDLYRSPEEFLYVGDTGIDMKTANAAGMYAVGALWGFRTGDELLAEGARALTTSPEDLLRVL